MAFFFTVDVRKCNHKVLMCKHNRHHLLLSSISALKRGYMLQMHQ